MYEGSHFSISSPTLTFFLNHRPSSGCLMVSHCSLIYIFVMTNNVEYLCMCLSVIHISFLVKCLFKSAHVLITLSVLVSYNSYLHILDIMTIPDVLPPPQSIIYLHFLTYVF